MRVLLLALALFLLPGSAEAGPIAAAIGAIGTAISGAISGSAFLAGLAQAAISFGLSMIAQKLLAKKPETPGQQVDALRTGENVSESFVVGRWATEGHFIYHGSHGRQGDTPNAYYQRVIQLSGMPGVSVRAVIMNGRYVQFGEQLDPEEPLAPVEDEEGTPAFVGGVNGMPPILLSDSLGSTADYGYAAQNQKFANMFWLKWFDGNQDFADPQLVDNYTNADNPWTNAHVGDGIAYAVVTWLFNPEVWQGGIPSVRFVLDGIPLYDPRADSSVGGDGAQRWNNRATWAQTDNPMVIAYNVARGITLPDGQIYGGTYAHDGGLPLDTWVAAMNVCDEVVNNRPRYRFGAEVKVAEVAPADLMDACAAACNGMYVPTGNALYVHAGAPAVPLLTITDDDISASDPETMDPIKGLAARHNGINASYIDPRSLWEPRNLPPILNQDWEAEDGGRRLVIDASYAGVFNRGQARDLAKSDIADERRQRQHQFALPPEYARLKCADTIAWTSARNGYANKLFEVTSKEQRTDDLFCIVNLRERDPDDYDFDADPALLDPVTPPAPTPAQAVPGFAVTGYIVQDADGNNRRPAIRMTWVAAEASDVRNLRWRARVAGSSEVVATGTATVADGEAFVEGVIPGETYEVRARLIADRANDWTPWLSATAPDVRLGRADIVAELQTAFDYAFDLTGGAVENIDGVVGDLRDSLQIALGIDITGPGSMVPTVAIPSIANIENALGTIQMQLATGELLREQLAQRVRDAGIYVDPENAEVKIRAVNALEDRATVAEIRVDGIAAAVEILAQAADFDENGILESFNEIEASFDALNAEINLRATTLRVDGIEVSLTETIATLDEQGVTLGALESDVIGLDSRLSAAELQISAIDGVSEIAATVEAVQQLAAADQGATEMALATEIINGLLGREFDRLARAAGRQSISAWISDEGEARAQAVLELEATVGDNEAEISNLAATRVTASGAVAAVNQQISAEYNGLSAMASATAFAEATADGIIEGFLWRTGAGGLLELVSVENGTGGPVTTARIRGDYIRLDGDTQVLGNFLVQGENIVLDGDVTVTGGFSITEASISGDFTSDNYAESGGVPTAGFKLERDSGVIKGVNFINTSGLVSNAVTKSYTTTFPLSPSYNPTGSWVTVASLSFEAEEAGDPILFYFRGSAVTDTSSEFWDFLYRLRYVGQTITNEEYFSTGVLRNPDPLFLHSFAISPSTLSHVFQLQVFTGLGSGKIEGTLLAIEIKR